MKVHPTANKFTLNTLTRVIILICGLGLIVVLITPIWRIELMAPQYPEGLKLLIYANKLAGNVDIINGLNHYIGMKTLHEDDFIEFKVLPYIIVFFSFCFIFVAIAAKRKWLNILCVMFVAFGVLAMVDFWRWEYNYGHNLNPDAAIIVPGMAYQPPLIGFKQLLNFGAFSIPAIGGWIFIAVGVALLACVIYEWRRAKKSLRFSSAKYLSIIIITSLTLSACSTVPEPLKIGKDNCHFCKMTIVDSRFGAEIVTSKGKVYKFDDNHCVAEFMLTQSLTKSEIAEVYFTNFCSPHELVNVKQAYFLQSPKLKSPMNGNIAAFSNQDSLTKVIPQFYGNAITWEDMQK
jgi:copper chaperone NosL